MALAEVKPIVHVNRELVNMLRRYLSQAESGEISGIVGIKTWSNGDGSPFWCIGPDNCRLERMIGQLGLLEADLKARALSLDPESSLSKLFEDY